MEKLYGLSGRHGNPRLRKSRERSRVASIGPWQDEGHMPFRRLVPLLALPAAFLATAFPAAMGAPIPVRFPEGITHGFLALRTTDGKTIARGDLLQLLREGKVESRVVFHFNDGSLHDEVAVFSQDKVFTMLSYHIVQKGPSFPWDIDAAVESSGAYTVTYRKPKSAPETVKGDLDLPPDVYNGMVTHMVKNLAGGKRETIHVVAFSPKPRVVELEVFPVGKSQVSVEGTPRTIVEYTMKPDLGGLLERLSKLVGQHPPDFHCWITDGEIPAFVRFEGPFYFKTPIWRIELVAPEGEK
jgi:hypothetical protein